MIYSGSRTARKDVLSASISCLRDLVFSCRTRGFCPSCHSKRLEEWGEWVREVTEGGMDGAGVFHKIFRIDDSRLAELSGREVLADLVRKELLSPEWAERILSWRHTGFNVHSRVQARTKDHASYYTPLDMSIID